MKRIPLALALCGLLLIPAIGAGPIAQQASAPRDLTAHDAALADVQTKATDWATAVGNSDQARDAYDQALAALNAALAAEATARADLETAQADYATAYGDVPKEDSLAP